MLPTRQSQDAQPKRLAQNSGEINRLPKPGAVYFCLVANIINAANAIASDNASYTVIDTTPLFRDVANRSRTS